jgi:alpha-glucosidase
MIKSLPTVWDETRVLPFSEIGEVAAFVRRHGSDWFIIIANGPVARSLRIPLTFLDRRGYASLLVRDNADDPAAVRVERSTMRRGDTLSIDLRAGGGFLARFS